MKLLIILVSVAVAAARPDSNYPNSKEEVIAILRDDRIQPKEGSYAFDFETADGILRSEAGESDTSSGAVVQAGQVSYPLPDGTLFELKYVAGENGYQPQSDFLPTPPPFPFKLPPFVIEQIERAERERAAGLDPSRSYE